MAPTVAVIGGGYGGASVAKALDDVAGAVLIEPRDAFALYRPGDDPLDPRMGGCAAPHTPCGWPAARSAATGQSGSPRTRWSSPRARG